MTNEKPSLEELRERVKALDTPVEPAHTEPAVLDRANLDLAHKEEKSPSMWRVLLQMRVLLPYLSRLVPLLDGSVHQATAQTHELQHGLSEVQAEHKELRLHMQGEAVQLKRVEEQLERLRETTERNTQEQQELIEDLKSFRGTIKALATLGVLLLLANGGLLIYLVVRLRHHI